jgi:membrane protease YdiL (CAAX protease family)
MTALALPRTGRLARPALIVAALVAATGLRWAATVSQATSGVSIGVGFGVSLIGLAVVTGWRPARLRASSVTMGAIGGAALVAITFITGPALVPGLGAASALGPWAVATVLVASAEEALLRGALFDALETAAGTGAAVALTSLVFALMHVPLYGWHVVPLDLGVGIWFAGLRLASGGVGGPAIAHSIADLATWWLR